jgi:hypothetical protein
MSKCVGAKRHHCEAAKISSPTTKHKIMNYMLLVAETQADLDKRTDPVKARALGEAWQAYGDALRKTGFSCCNEPTSRSRKKPKSATRPFPSAYPTRRNGMNEFPLFLMRSIPLTRQAGKA